MLSSVLGYRWESSLFVRLRQLPNGDVEYRDGSGEVRRFATKDGKYSALIGLSLKLVPTSSGWNMLDQKMRITSFDSLGRIVSESDQFFNSLLVSLFVSVPGRPSEAFALRWRDQR